MVYSFLGKDETTRENLYLLSVKIVSVVPRARHCGIPAILPPMSLKNAPSEGIRAHLENLLIMFRCFLLFPYLV